MTHIGGTTRTCAVCLVTHSPIRGPSFRTHSGQRNVLWEMFESPTVETGQTRTSKNIVDSSAPGPTVPRRVQLFAAPPSPKDRAVGASEFWKLVGIFNCLHFTVPHSYVRLVKHHLLGALFPKSRYPERKLLAGAAQSAGGFMGSIWASCSDPLTL